MICSYHARNADQVFSYVFALLIDLATFIASRKLDMSIFPVPTKSKAVP